MQHLGMIGGSGAQNEQIVGQHLRLDREAAGGTLRDSEARYRRLFETAQDGILILDAVTGAITDVNPFCVELLGYRREELLGKAPWEIGFSGNAEATKEGFRRLMVELSVRCNDLCVTTKRGQVIPVEVMGNVYWVNGVEFVQCHIRDITQQKQAERIEERKSQAQKMEAVGQLAGGLAHDFNNLLGVILGYCELLTAGNEVSESARKMIERISAAGDSAKNLTQHLLAFSRRQVLEPVVLDLNEAVERIYPMLKRLIGAEIELRQSLGAELGSVLADPNHIEQVLMNLAINARDAMPKGGVITFETTNVEADEIYGLEHDFVEPGGYVVLTVRDTGTGMSQETQTHIFDPFFTTKELGKGTGLGLSTVFGIVKQCRGVIGVSSVLGQGTSFHIHFPRCDAAPAAVRAAKTTPVRGGTETILLVDDAALLRPVTRLFLEQGGYTVLESGDWKKALKMAKLHVGPLPLMITDVTISGVTGEALAAGLAVTRPDAKVLFTSGYADASTAQHQLRNTKNAFIEKPFTRDALLRKVREILDES